MLLLGLLTLPAKILLAEGDTLNLGQIKAPTIRVQTVTPRYDSATNMLELQAALNFDPKLLKTGKDFSIEWTIEGPANGFKLVANGDPFKTGLTLGDSGQTATIKACLVYGPQPGGCRTITLKSEKIQACTDKEYWQKIPEKEWDDLICTGVSNDAYQYVFYKVRSTVNTLAGKYNRTDIDLQVKVPGGRISIQRKYENDHWHWDHEKDNLTFDYGEDAELRQIKKGRVVYRRSTEDRLQFIHGTYRLFKNDDGYWWEDKKGNFKSFDKQGRILLSGNRSGVIQRYIYGQKSPDNLIAIQDRHRKRVMKLRYFQGKLASIEDPLKRRVRYSYRNNRLEKVITPANREIRYSYHPDGTLAGITDAAGHKIEITYDANRRVASVTDEKGRGHRFKFQYDIRRGLYYVRTESSAGRVREVWHTREGEAREVRLNGRLVKKIEKQDRKLIITRPGGHQTVKEFDHFENLLKTTYPDGSQVINEYHPKFNLRTKTVDENGIVTEFAYDKKGRLVRRVEAVGRPEERTTEFSWDNEGNRVLEKRLGDDLTAEASTRMVYDQAGNMTAITDAEGHTTRFTHDYRGNIMTRIDPSGARWLHTYDLSGNRIKTIDPLGHVTDFRFDALGNRIAVTDPKGRRTRFVYDDAQRMIEKVDPLGGITRFEYDAYGRTTRQVDPEGRQTKYEYDQAGRLAATIDGVGNRIATEYADDTPGNCRSCSAGNSDGSARIHYPTFTREFSYDLRGRKITEKDMAAGVELRESRFKYDAVGNLIEKIDPMGNVTAYVYDSLRRLVKTIDPKGGETKYTYDLRDNLIALTDANGNTTRFEYNRNNKLVREIRPMGQATVFKYDAMGNLSEKTDPRGIRSVYKFGLDSRLLATEYYSSPGESTPAKIVKFTYDQLGNMATYADGTTSAKYTYDELNRKTSESVNYGKFTLIYHYEYYKNGLKKSYPSPEGRKYRYAYDEANRLKSVAIPGQGTISWDSYKWKLPAQITLPGGTTRITGYDPLMRIETILAKTRKGKTILDYRYKYNRADNITLKSTEHGDYVYTYDDLYQLIGAENPQSDDEYFTYDRVGNRLSDAKTKGQWKYNRNNELLKAGPANFQYDTAGNTIEKTADTETIKYLYNPEGRLERISDGNARTVASYYYDPFGKRLYKEVDGKRTYFLYTDEGLSGEYNQKGKAIKSYGFKPNSTWTTDPLFMKVGRHYYYYHNDHLGTPQKMVKKSGQIGWSTIYKSFGNTTILKQPTTSNNFRFPGQYSIDNFELSYNWHRYYDPKTGRFLIHDPIGLNGGINLYVYSNNNPISQIDPKGLAGIGGGAYLGGGAETTFSITNCCEKKNKFRVKILTVCGGVGIGISGTPPIGVTTGSVSSRTGCPRTRYYFKHDTALIYRSVYVQGDSKGPSAGIDGGIHGISTAWAFCSDTLISKEWIGCCEE